MKTFLLLALLIAAPAHALTKTTCGNDIIGGIPVQWCTQNGIEFDHTHVLWYFHGYDEPVSAYLDSPDYLATRIAWRNVYGVVPPVAIAISYGNAWTLSDMPSQHVAGAPVLYDLVIKQVMPYLEAKLVGPGTITRRWLMGKSMGGYNASLMLERKPAGYFKKAVLGCPANFTVGPFSDDATRDAYVARNPGTQRSAVDFGLSLLSADEPTKADWSRNNPLAMLNNLNAVTNLYVWFNTTDQYGFEEGARALINIETSRGLTVFSRSNTGGHCLMDAGMNDDIANFLR